MCVPGQPHYTQRHHEHQIEAITHADRSICLSFSPCSSLSLSRTTNSFDKNNKRLERGFCSFILKPIEALFGAVMNAKKDVYEPMLPKLGIAIPKENKDDVGKPLLKVLMQEWLPAAHALLHMICNHLPSPAVAQSYRIENLYSGPMDDEVAKSVHSNTHAHMHTRHHVPSSPATHQPPLCFCA